MSQLRVLFAGLALLLVATATPLLSQQELPLAPIPPRGLPVSPFFEGWYLNPDGTYTLSFGYFNRNAEETIEIPIGPDNFIEPAELNGGQPTSFPPRRVRGVFAVTVPADYVGKDVVWTLRHRGGTYSVPGRLTSPAYELGHAPMAAGSVPPAIRFSENGPTGRGIVGIRAETALQTRVDAPVTIDVWVDDFASKRDPVPLAITWFKHTGPGAVTFEPPNQRNITDGRGSTAATFGAPGEYLIRVRVDNHASNDSSEGDQCCWSNGYIPVVVTE